MTYCSWTDSKWYIFGTTGDSKDREGEYLFVWLSEGENVLDSMAIYSYDDVRAMVDDDDLLSHVPGFDPSDKDYLRTIFERWLKDVDDKHGN